ncbi:chorismate synthase [Sulfuricurvum sp. IAE1]|jgi:chorismate synthase|uniref:chorismate synthase n=1 Tax=Sulfuricurvum sp. IAE1 TaxID=2546102 RepID=UPI00104683E0|nr:chorismate synthase [Sulfuricurvum sp. IAE1]MDD3770313.1 chorismate synthase [Sulfuricurvum sp.]MDX9966377.1 chorismate synthase [Sulfuricurvum sp.]TDA62615.1 chorismate synthase [Sulfuricurvum sp. IAE1]
MNRFGERFTITTFGESHGKAIGCVLDGVPAGLAIDEAYIQSELDRRRPGQNEFATARKEADKVEILSGVFEGKSTGTPIMMVIYNTDQKSGDYSNVKDIFRPGHADFTYFHKYGIRDYRGGGRSSARETAARVAGGAVAKLMLRELGIDFASGISAIEGIEANTLDFSRVANSPIYALDPSVEEAQKEAILRAKNAHDAVGGVATVKISGLPVGLGEGLYYKLDAVLAEAMMGINAVKAVEIGEGVRSARLRASENNDPITPEGFKTNHAGGILGGMSNGDDILVRVHFKPTPSIFIDQESIDTAGHSVHVSLKGRHDPCVAVRGSVVAESMAALVCADMVLLNMGRTMKGLKGYYG